MRAQLAPQGLDHRRQPWFPWKACGKMRWGMVSASPASDVRWVHIKLGIVIGCRPGPHGGFLHRGLSTQNHLRTTGGYAA